MNYSYFNFDSLTESIKRIEFGNFGIYGEKLFSLEKNNWKLEKTDISISSCSDHQARKILDSLNKVKQVEVSEGPEEPQELTDLMKDYPQFKFLVK